MIDFGVLSIGTWHVIGHQKCSWIWETQSRRGLSLCRKYRIRWLLSWRTRSLGSSAIRKIFQKTLIAPPAWLYRTSYNIHIPNKIISMGTFFLHGTFIWGDKTKRYTRMKKEEFIVTFFLTHFHIWVILLSKVITTAVRFNCFLVPNHF